MGLLLHFLLFCWRLSVSHTLIDKESPSLLKTALFAPLLLTNPQNIPQPYESEPQRYISHEDLTSNDGTPQFSVPSFGESDLLVGEEEDDEDIFRHIAPDGEEGSDSLIGLPEGYVKCRIQERVSKLVFLCLPGNLLEPVKVLRSEDARKEVLAYRLDQDGRAGVPKTELIPRSEGEAVSMQDFIQSSFHADELPSNIDRERLEYIAFLDLRLHNVDRHYRNIALQDDTSGRRVIPYPIDHGYSLEYSEYSLRPLIFCFLGDSQFSPRVRRYIERYDIDRDLEFLDTYGYSHYKKQYIQNVRHVQEGIRSGKSVKEIAGFARDPSQVRLLSGDMMRYIDC